MRCSELTGGQQDAEIVLGIYVEQLGLDLPILSFGEHVRKYGKEDVRTVGFGLERKRQADGSALFVEQILRSFR